jgi:hypothetical protein
MRLDDLGIDFSKGTFTDSEISIIKRFTDDLPVHCVCILLRAKFLLSRHCFVVPKTYTLHYVYTIVRRHTSAPPGSGIFLIVNNMIPLTSYTLGFVKSQYGDKATGLVVFDVFMENTFGTWTYLKKSEK